MRDTCASPDWATGPQLCVERYPPPEAVSGSARSSLWVPRGSSCPKTDFRTEGLTCAEACAFRASSCCTELVLPHALSVEAEGKHCRHISADPLSVGGTTHCSSSGCQHLLCPGSTLTRTILPWACSDACFQQTQVVCRLCMSKSKKKKKKKLFSAGAQLLFSCLLLALSAG